MKITQAEVGMAVAYRSHPSAEPEDGIITEIISNHLVRVRYTGDTYAKATPIRSLTRVEIGDPS